MKPTFSILTGGRAGLIFTPAGDVFSAGRHADAELRFDADADLSVSARHAEFVRFAEIWHVRDLHSRNGTFVNGSCITAQTPLADGDTITFGADGPRVQFRSVATAVSAERESTTQRLRAAMRREIRRVRIAAGAVIVLLLVLAGAMLLGDQREARAVDAERHRLQARIDSLLDVGQAAEANVQGEVSGLRAALQQSEARLRALRTELESAPADAGETALLQRQLLAAGSALRRQQLAASLDFQLIERRNRSAVAMIWVEYTDGSRVTGTAFAANGDGTMITNRHLVNGHSGTQSPRRIAVRFADSEQVFPARVVAVANDTDLAVLQVQNVIGDVPSIHGLNGRADTLSAGAPVALIGFPLGGDFDPDGSPRVARPLLSAGVLVTRSEHQIDVQGLGAAGGSGSPILDAHGELVGVLFGGRTDAGVQVLAAVPVGLVRALLATLR